MHLDISSVLFRNMNLSTEVSRYIGLVRLDNSVRGQVVVHGV